MAINRGEIYKVSLDPTVGFEIGLKVRPVVVVSINFINQKPLVVTVVPGTGSFKPTRSYRNVAVISPTSGNGLTKPTAFQCHQIRALDYARFVSGPIGMLGSDDLRKIEDAIRFVIFGVGST